MRGAAAGRARRKVTPLSKPRGSATNGRSSSAADAHGNAAPAAALDAAVMGTIQQAKATAPAVLQPPPALADSPVQPLYSSETASSAAQLSRPPAAGTAAAPSEGRTEHAAEPEPETTVRLPNQTIDADGENKQQSPAQSDHGESSAALESDINAPPTPLVSAQPIEQAGDAQPQQPRSDEQQLGSPAASEQDRASTPPGLQAALALAEQAMQQADPTSLGMLAQPRGADVARPGRVRPDEAPEPVTGFGFGVSNSGNTSEKSSSMSTPTPTSSSMPSSFTPAGAPSGPGSTLPTRPGTRGKEQLAVKSGAGGGPWAQRVE